MDLDALAVLPASWRARLTSKRIVPVDAGMSGASVFRIADKQGTDQYLKIGTGASASLVAREIERTAWLAAAGIRVPAIIAQFNRGDVAAVTMAALDGRNAGDIGPNDWRAAVAAIARAFARLHALAPPTCPFDEALKVRLARARALIEAGEIDPAHFDARNRGVTPAELYARLAANVPAHEDLVVVHGDATLSNLILGDDGEIGFLDCGNCGKADRYVDLALLAAELDDRFGPAARDGFIAAYGLPWDQRKADFYLDLYELF